MSGPASDLGIACVQMEPRRGDVEGNIARAVRGIEEAAASGNDLIVLPELTNSGYSFRDRAEAWRLGEELDGATCRAWSDVARKRGVWVVGGLAERDGRSLYDTVVVFDPAGEMISRYRKMHLWSTEHLWFEPGREPSEVLRLPFGRLAVAICFDLWVPELFRHYARAGADIVCMPSNWSSPPTVKGTDRPIVDYIARSTAHVNSIYLVGADRAGSDEPFAFLGASMIVNPRGEIVSRAEIPADEELVCARVDVMEARVRKTWSRFNRATEVSHHLASHRDEEGS